MALKTKTEKKIIQIFFKKKGGGGNRFRASITGCDAPQVKGEAEFTTTTCPRGSVAANVRAGAAFGEAGGESRARGRLTVARGPPLFHGAYDSQYRTYAPFGMGSLAYPSTGCGGGGGALGGRSSNAGVSPGGGGGRSDWATTLFSNVTFGDRSLLNSTRVTFFCNNGFRIFFQAVFFFFFSIDCFSTQMERFQQKHYQKILRYHL